MREAAPHRAIYFIKMDPYQPHEDSYLLAYTIGKFLEYSPNKPRKALDMGSGRGIQAEILQSSQVPKVLCADIDSEVIKSLEARGFNATQSDLFENIKAKFDLIVFNPPYLPGNYKEDPTTLAGPKGNELIIKFLDHARNHLEPKGSILLLFSSLSDGKTIVEEAGKMNYTGKQLTELPLFQEKLYVYQFCCPC